MKTSTFVTTLASLLLALFFAAPLRADVALPDAKPVPRMQVIPLPDDRASIRRDGEEVTRYHFSPRQERPFLYPIIGPSGRSLTRMGHPHDPTSHSHHNSVWLSHHTIDGVDFWSDRRFGVIEHQRIIQYADDDDAASILALIHWNSTGKGKDDNGDPLPARTVLIERRKMTVRPLPGGESLILIDTQLHTPADKPVTINQNPFGLIGVRMAKTIGIHDGGGLIRNSEGNVNEQGDNGCFRKPAKWCDYSGPITNDAIEGVTLMDHPHNPGHPTPFHVRGDGWMGACLTLRGPRTIEPQKPLRLRYGLYIHRGAPEVEKLEARWKKFAEEKVEPLPEKAR